MEQEDHLPTVSWLETLDLKGKEDEEKADIDFRGCLAFIRKSYEYTLAESGHSMTDSANSCLKRGLRRFAAYEEHVQLMRGHKVYIEKNDHSGIYKHWFRKDPDFHIEGGKGERLHFEAGRLEKRIVQALATLLGLEWQHFIQVVLSIGILGNTDIPVVYHREAEGVVRKFNEWINEKVEKAAEYVGIVKQQRVPLKVVCERKSFDDILKGE